MGRTPVLSADGLKKGAWTDEEDQRLKAYVQKHGEGGWRSLPEKAGLQRCGKSCRLRWANYLRPGIKRGGFTSEEDQTIIQLHAKLGNRWAAIARHLPKRTDNEIKNYWNAHLKKRLSQMGIDPVTHKPVSSGAAAASSSGNSETTVVNAEDTNSTHNEITPTAQESESTVLQQPTLSSRSTSASALLLNNLATRVTSRLTTFLQCVDPLRVNQTLQPMAFNATGDGGADTTDITDINCHPDSSFQGNDASTTEPDTSDYWLDNISDPITTPLISPALSNTVLSQESADHVNASDNATIEYPVSDHASSNIVENKAPESVARSFSGSQAIVLNKVASNFASLHCIDELHDRQNSNNNSPGPIQDDHNYDGGLSAGDINIDDLIFDNYTLGSPIFYNSNYLENELEPSDFFNIP